MDYTRKKYADSPVGNFWLEIARLVIEGMAMAGEKAYPGPPQGPIQIVAPPLMQRVLELPGFANPAYRSLTPHGRGTYPPGFIGSGTKRTWQVGSVVYCVSRDLKIGNSRLTSYEVINHVVSEAVACVVVVSLRVWQHNRCWNKRNRVRLFVHQCSCG
jgi:hypothetical protein